MSYVEFSSRRPCQITEVVRISTACGLKTKSIFGCSPGLSRRPIRRLETRMRMSGRGPRAAVVMLLGRAGAMDVTGTPALPSHGLCVNLYRAMQTIMQHLRIQIAGPPRDHQRCHAVSNHISDGPSFRHEPVDAENQR